MSRDYEKSKTKFPNTLLYWPERREGKCKYALFCKAGETRQMYRKGGLVHSPSFGHLRRGKGLAFDHIMDQMKLRSKKPSNQAASPALRYVLTSQASAWLQWQPPSGD